MDIIKEAEAIVAKKMERDDVVKMARRFERDGMAEARALEMALEVFEMSEEYGIGLYIDEEGWDGDILAE